MANSLRLEQSLPTITRSLELYERAKKLIPAVTQTLAKGVSQNSFGVSPIYIQRGKGSHVWDVDGNEYLDYSMGVGPVSLGYNHPQVDDAIREQLNQGIVFSLPHPLESEVAELLHDVVPNAEMCRFSKGGADVTSAAIRVARAATGRSTVLCCGYHGWHDWYIATTDRNAGIPASAMDQTFTFGYNDIPSLEAAIGNDVAAVILEPTTFIEPHENFLHRLRDLCTEHGCLLIFDEMWTGFRLALGGAQEYFGVRADLACFSKAIANGMPLSVLTGKQEYMRLLDRDVFFFNTFGGETLSLAAAKATISFMREHNVAQALDAQGRLLKDGLQAIIDQLDIPYLRCIGFPCRTLLQINHPDALLIKTYIQQELLRCGILWTGSHVISYSHGLEDIDYTLAAYHSVLTALRPLVAKSEVQSKLHGALLEPVFRKTTHFNTKPRFV